MKKRARALILFAMTIVLIGCGDATKNKYFDRSMIHEVWTFQSTCENGLAATTTIEVQAPPRNSGLDAVWHYTKSDVCTYWNPGDRSELWFGLKQNADGSWSSPKFEATCQFCMIGTTVGSVTIKALQYGGYMVIPPDKASSTTGETGYFPCWTGGILTWETNDCDVVGVTPVPWNTDGYIERVSTPVYKGLALVSEQREGSCPESCTHEKWYFAPHAGIVKIEQLERLSTKGVVIPDPPTTLVRIK